MYKIIEELYYTKDYDMTFSYKYYQRFAIPFNKLSINSLSVFISNYTPIRILNYFINHFILYYIILPNTKIVLLSLTAMGGDQWGRNNGKAVMNNVKIKDNLEDAVEFIIDCILNTLDDDSHRYGVKFEKLLYSKMKRG